MSKLNPTLIDESNTTSYWKVDGSGDDSIGSNDGTPTNVIYETAGRGYSSEVGDFNGSSSYLSLPTGVVTASNSFSYNCWFQWDTGTAFSFMGNTTTGTSGISLNYGNVFGAGSAYDGKIWAYKFGRATSNVNGSYTLNTGWNMVTFVCTSSGMKIYMNGSEIASNTNTDAIKPSGNPLYVGGVYNAGLVYPFNGRIGEVRIAAGYSLTEQEIKNLYLEGLRQFGPTNEIQTYNLPATLSPTSYYPLNGDAKDYAGSNDGTWGGTEAYVPIWGGEAATFDGSTDYIDLTSVSTANSGSVTAWYTQTNGDIGFGAILCTGSTTNGNIVTLVGTNASGKLLIRRVDTAFNTDQVTTTAGGFDDEEWHFVVFTSNGSTWKIYVDGEEQALTVDSGTNNGEWFGAESFNKMSIGSYPRTSRAAYMNGNLALVTNYDNVTLSQADITKLYNQQSKFVVGNKYSLANLRDGLVLDISKKAVSGTYYDNSGNGNNSSSITAVTDSVKGLSNIMSFNGSTSEIAFSDKIIPTGAKTISTWIKTTDSGVNHLIGNCGINSLNNGTLLWTNSGHTEFNVVDGSGTSTVSIAGSKTINDGNYHLLTATWDGTTGTDSAVLYIDGIVDNTDTPTKTTEPTADDNLELGSTPGASTTYNYDGEMVEPKIRNRVLSAEEIQQLYHSEFIQN